jgi:hypothetical protein
MHPCCPSSSQDELPKPLGLRRSCDEPHNYNVGGLFDAGPSNNVNVRLSRETTISEDSERQTEENEQKRFHRRSVTESILHGKNMCRVAQRLRDSQ